MQQGICSPEFYGDLVYKFKKIIGTCLNICIIGGGNSRKLPVSVKGVNSITCPIINIETIGGKSKNSILSYFLYKCHNCSCYV